jgi:signal transduction histidine kinase
MIEIKKILIVEDSATQAMHLEMVLEEKGYEVLHGKDGKDALQILEDNKDVDIIITDVVMPIMDGYEFCGNVKKNPNTQDIPVILLTQLSNPDDVIKGLQAGADNFVSKPYSEDFLFERINDILLNREIRKRSPNLDIAVEIFFGGQKYKLNSNRLQILDLLLSTYYNAINKNKELEERNIQLKELHAKLKHNNIELNKSIDEKNYLLGIAAHDLRSPLSLISSYFSLVTDSVKEGSFSGQEKIFSTINKTVDFMLNMVTEVLDYAKVESGKVDLNYKEFDLTLFMDDAIELNNILSKQKGILINSSYPKIPIIVSADENKLKQVMDNLLSNAVKYSELNTEINIFIEKLDGEIKVVVEDHGFGIPNDELNKLFQPFSTTSVRSSAGEKSTGLGLVSVKKIIETHHGRIWVESEVGVGSKFIFIIPIK